MPDFTPDFTTVHAATPIWKKNTYELTIDKVTGRAYDQQKDGAPTGTVVRFVNLTPKMVGVYDSKGKLKTDLDGANIAGQPVEGIRLYIHSEGALRYSKGIMMSILGYDRNKPQSEEEFNAFLKTLDLSFELTEREDGEGYDVTLGEGWQVLANKNVKAQMSVGQREAQDGKKVDQQEFDNFYPVV